MAGEEYQVGGLSIAVDVDSTRVASGLATVQSQVAAVSGAIEGEIAVQDRAATSTTAWTSALAKQASASADAAMKIRAQRDAFDSASFVASSTAIANMGTNLQSAGAAAGGGGARGLLLFSQAVEDAQYGMSAIVNNVPGVLMAFGAGAGLAGAASIAMVGISQLTKGMQGLQDVMIGTAVSDPIKRLEDMAKATKLTADEQQRLNELKKAEKEYEAIKGRESKTEQAQQKAFDVATEDISGKAITGGVRAALKAEGAGAGITAEEEKYLAASKTIQKYQQGSIGMRMAAGIGRLLGFKDIENAGREIQARKDMLDEGNVKRILTGARSDMGPAGDAMREQLLGLVRRHPEAFPGLSEQDVLAMSPKERERQSAEVKSLEVEQRRNVAAYDERKANERLAIDLELEQRKGVAAYDDQKLASDLESEQKRNVRVYDEQKKSQAEIDKGMRENVSGFLRQDEDRARLGERGSDLQWRLANLMNPERQGMTMGGDQYAGSFHSTTGLSEEAKRLHAIQEINKQIEENTRKYNLIGVRKRK